MTQTTNEQSVSPTSVGSSHTTTEEHDDSLKNITLEILAEQFRLPFYEAAQRLGMCQTSLKKICRKLGIVRWPQRKLRCIDKKLACLNTELSYNRNPNPKLATQLRRLEDERDTLFKGPGIASGAAIARAGAAVDQDSSASDSDSSESVAPPPRSGRKIVGTGKAAGGNKRSHSAPRPAQAGKGNKNNNNGNSSGDEKPSPRTGKRSRGQAASLAATPKRARNNAVPNRDGTSRKPPAAAMTVQQQHQLHRQRASGGRPMPLALIQHGASHVHLPSEQPHGQPQRLYMATLLANVTSSYGQPLGSEPMPNQQVAAESTPILKRAATSSTDTSTDRASSSTNTEKPARKPKCNVSFAKANTTPAFAAACNRTSTCTVTAATLGTGGGNTPLSMISPVAMLSLQMPSVLSPSSGVELSVADVDVDAYGTSSLCSPGAFAGVFSPNACASSVFDMIASDMMATTPLSNTAKATAASNGGTVMTPTSMLINTAYAFPAPVAASS